MKTIDLNNLAERVAKVAYKIEFYEIEQQPAILKMTAIAELSSVIPAFTNLYLAWREKPGAKSGMPNPLMLKQIKDIVYRPDWVAIMGNGIGDAFVSLLLYSKINKIYIKYNDTYVSEMCECCEDEDILETISCIVAYMSEEEFDVNKVIHSILGVGKAINVDLLDLVETKIRSSNI